MTDAKVAPQKPGKTPKGVRLGGRQKGTPNKTTGQLKEMILQALAGAGGIKYLQEQAEKNPGPFMTLVGKVLPMQIGGDKDNPIRTRVDVHVIRS